MTYRDDLLHQALSDYRYERDLAMAEAWAANILVEICKRELGYSADCRQAVDMISEGSPVPEALNPPEVK